MSRDDPLYMQDLQEQKSISARNVTAPFNPGAVFSFLEDQARIHNYVNQYIGFQRAST